MSEERGRPMRYVTVDSLVSLKYDPFAGKATDIEGPDVGVFQKNS